MEASLTGEAIQEYPTHTSLIMEVSIGSECNSIGVGKVSLPSVRMIMARCCTKPSKDPTHHPSLLSCRHTRPSSENTQLFLIINTASAVPRLLQPRDKFWFSRHPPFWLFNADNLQHFSRYLFSYRHIYMASIGCWYWLQETAASMWSWTFAKKFCFSRLSCLPTL